MAAAVLGFKMGFQAEQSVLLVGILVLGLTGLGGGKKYLNSQGAYYPHSTVCLLIKRLLRSPLLPKSMETLKGARTPDRW